MIACHDGLNYRIGSVKEIPTWMDTFHLVALSAHEFPNHTSENKRGSRLSFLFRSWDAMVTCTVLRIVLHMVTRIGYQISRDF